MSKIIKAVFTGRFCKTQRVFQFDTDDKLQIVNVDLPASFTVDFSNSKTGDSVSVLATSDTVQIPPDLFVPGSEIYAWIWLSDSNGGHTKCEACIPIDPRARRTGAEPTPAQASAWDEAVDTLNEAAEDYADAMGHGPQIIDGYWHIWDADAGEYINTNVKAEGEDGEPGAPGVGVPSGGSTGQVLKKASGTDYDTEWADESGGGGVTVDDEISGSSTNPVQNKVIKAALDGKYTKPSSGIPAADLSASVQARLEPDVLRCMYGLTQSGEIQDALDDGILPVAFRGDNYYMYSGYDDSLGYVFTRSTLTDIYRISCKNNVWSAGTLGIPQLSSATPAALGTASAGSATSSSKADHVHPMPSAADIGAYSKPSGGIPASDLASAVQTSLGKADTALQSAPVTSVNGQTGAVTLSIPSTASDVGAVAVAQGVTARNKVLKVDLFGNVVTEDTSVVVTFTPTSPDYSGTIDWSPANLADAYDAGKRIIAYAPAFNFRCELSLATIRSGGLYTFDFIALGEMNGQDIMLRLLTSDSTSTYTVKIYPLATGQWTGGSY